MKIPISDFALLDLGAPTVSAFAAPLLLLYDRIFSITFPATSVSR